MRVRVFVFVRRCAPATTHLRSRVCVCVCMCVCVCDWDCCRDHPGQRSSRMERRTRSSAAFTTRGGGELPSRA
eukprot:5734698-Pyramimonas_sp.AAC.1